MAVEYTHNKQTASGTTRLSTCLVLGVVALLVAGKLLSWRVAPLLAWDTAALTYICWMALTIRRLQDNETRNFALREDPSRALADGVLTFASLASLLAVGVVLVGSSGGDTVSRLAQVGLGVVSVIVSWALTHTVFMLRYAELYYHDRAGGVQFDGTSQPTFKDFAYLAFTIGMTFQVSDTGFQSTPFRALALRHALLSYVFGTVIVATTINLVAGLSK